MNNQRYSPFLALPAELRNIIYRYVLPKGQEVTITDQGYIRTNLLLANRQIHSELWLMAFERSSYRIRVQDYNTDTLHRWTMVTRAMIARHTPRGALLEPLPEVTGGSLHGPNS